MKIFEWLFGQREPSKWEKIYNKAKKYNGCKVSGHLIWIHEDKTIDIDLEKYKITEYDENDEYIRLKYRVGCRYRHTDDDDFLIYETEIGTLTLRKNENDR